MKITIQTDASVQETTLSITCREITPELERLIEALRITDKKLSVLKSLIPPKYQYNAGRRTRVSCPDARFVREMRKIFAFSA